MSLEEEATLSKEEVLRYSRHLIIPEVGMKGQLKLKKAKVLLIGTGGLGSPLGLYLAAAGVGTIGLLDFDVVDQTNLQRQVAFGTKDVSRPKVEAAKERLQGVNPHVKFVTHKVKLTSLNAMEILKGYDIIVDGTDNFPTRYLVNDACVLLKKPNVYGSIFRFDGQVAVFDSQRGPCYRCLYGSPPPPGMVPSCAEGGVIGVLPGIVGTLQALETVKLITGIGEPLIGGLLLFDGLKMQFRKLKLKKNPDCPICSENPTLKGLIDYDEFCGIGQEEEHILGKEWEISPTELNEYMKSGKRAYLLDVRESYEVEICTIENSHLIPLGEIPERMSELNSADFIVAYCRMGSRSARAVELLRQAGFRKIKNLAGGILAWSDDVDPAIAKY